jgi:SagB-type dehydrogenase family enzyme
VNEPFTVRVDGVLVTVSSDDGRSVRLEGGDIVGALRDWFAVVADKLDFGVPSAAALAAFAESAAVAPLAQPQVSSATPETDGVALTEPDSAGTGDGRVAIGQYRRDDVFARLLAARESSRTYGPIDVAAVAGIVVDACRILTWDETEGGFQKTFRPYPSAGGRHPIDVYVVATHVEGLASGSWRFDATRCELVPDALRGDRLLAAARAALDVVEDPPALLVLVADFSRTLSRYPAGSTLVWRDAGVAAATMHLVASARGVASSIVGTAHTINLGGGRLAGDVGAVAVGGRLGDQ